MMHENLVPLVPLLLKSLTEKLIEVSKVISHLLNFH